MIERQKIIDRIKAELGEWEAELETLRVKANLGKMETRDKFHALENVVKEKVRPIRTKLKELSGETNEAWRDVAAGCERTWTETKSAIKQAIARYRK